MATRVNDGSKFCRDCGGLISEWNGETWCMKEECRPLGPANRRFCEHCGESVVGPTCKCGVPATFKARR
jgi:hypothetical protein